MGYIGQQAPVPLGQLGLRTDDPMTSLPPNAAILANNVDFSSSRLEKSRGSRLYNTGGDLPDPLVAGIDYWPTPTDQRLIVATSGGEIYRDTGSGTFNALTPIATGLLTLDTTSFFVTGGAEQAGNDKKLFFFTAGNQAKVLTGDGTSFANIATPPADWIAGQYPVVGCIFENRLIGISGHYVYGSKTSNHEDFSTTNPSDAFLFSVFPGEGDGIVACSVYKGRLFLFKRPFGVYYIDTNGSPVTANWSVKKLTDSFGVASSHALIQPQDDLVAGNNTNSITSMQATNAFGDIKNGDVLANNQVEQFYKENFDVEGIPFMHAVYYTEKKKALFTGRSFTSDLQNQILIMDVARQVIRFSIEVKDQPNFLSLRRVGNIDKPFYGTEDGRVFTMDDASYNVENEAYVGEFQTPHMDFSYMDASLSGKNKIYEFLDVQFIATGNWSFFVDYFIDNKYAETLNYSQFAGAALDSFILDQDQLAIQYTQTMRLPLHGTGKRISFKIYNNNLNEFFKVEKFIVSFRISGEQQNTISGVFSV